MEKKDFPKELRVSWNKGTRTVSDYRHDIDSPHYQVFPGALGKPIFNYLPVQVVNNLLDEIREKDTLSTENLKDLNNANNDFYDELRTIENTALKFPVSEDPRIQTLCKETVRKLTTLFS